MFERFTERARKVVVLAQDEARHFGHDYIGTEHVLLGLLREEEGVAAQSLAADGITADSVRVEVGSIVGYGEGTPAQAPFTRRTKKALEISLREALQLGHDYIGTEHLLLGLLHEREGVAAIALSNLSVDAERLRREILGRIGGGSRPERRRKAPVSSERTQGRPWGSSARNPWESGPLFENFTERARKVVVLAQDEARHFNHNYIGTEHILLGLVRESEGVAARALLDAGVDPDAVREEVLRLVSGGEPPRDPGRGIEGEAGIEEGERYGALFRGRVTGIGVGMMGPGGAPEERIPVVVDLDYEYHVTREGSDGFKTVDYARIRDLVERFLEACEPSMLEEVAGLTGDMLVGEVPQLQKVTVTATREGPGISVSATFRR